MPSASSVSSASSNSPFRHTYETTKFRIENTLDTWAEVSPSNRMHSSHRIPVGLDSYSMVDLVSISFVRSLGLSPCTRKSHQHIIPILEGVGQTSPRTHGFFHLKLTIIDCFNRSFTFIRPFLAVDRDAKDSQVLLGRPALKDFKINICNSDNSWEFEFERKPKVTKISLHQFAQELTSRTKPVVFEWGSRIPSASISRCF